MTAARADLLGESAVTGPLSHGSEPASALPAPSTAELSAIAARMFEPNSYPEPSIIVDLNDNWRHS